MGPADAIARKAGTAQTREAAEQLMRGEQDLAEPRGPDGGSKYERRQTNVDTAQMKAAWKSNMGEHTGLHELIKRDLQLQEKYFTDKLSPLPEKWVKEAEALSNKNRLAKHKFAVDAITNVPMETIKTFSDWFVDKDKAAQRLALGAQASDSRRAQGYQWDTFYADELKRVLINQRYSVCVFRPVDRFLTYQLTFCDRNLSLIKMSPINAGHNTEAQVEYYNILDIFLSNGLKPKVEISAQILNMMNERGVSALAGGNLRQTSLKNSDMVVLNHNSFERILIFDREESLSKNKTAKP